ncbi:hypothetical protein [Candidatus Poriferisodalis sp.]|uniref:hypothetical protein n=1 Tax=Candidatus Poriferisodalis sp. TaxID=3101277 RepID=UPI003B02A4F9
MSAALFYWVLISAYMLIVQGDELDLDAVFPLVGEAPGASVSYASTPSNPPSAVVAAFWIVGCIVGLPLVAPAKAIAVVLRISLIVVGACLLATVTRLGLLLVPVLALQLMAYYRSDLLWRS